MARLTDPVYLPPFDWSNGPRNDPHEIAFTEIQKAADALPEGEYEGALIKWQVADGYAVYRVEALDTRQGAVLAHVPFGDGYAVDDSLIRGLRVSDVIEKVEAERRLAALFGGKR